MKLVISIILRTFLISVTGILIALTLFYVFDNTGFLDKLSLNGRFHLLLILNKSKIMGAVCIIIVICAVDYSVSMVLRYVDDIVDSIDVIVNKKDEKIVKLPQELREIEDKLNKIKYTSLKNEKDALEAEQKKNDLIVYMAHDLKTPLTSIIGYLTLLNDDDNISNELKKKYLNITLDKSEKLEELINEFFDITRFNLHSMVLEKEVLNLSLMLRQLAEEFTPQFSSKNLTYKLNISENIKIEADVNKIVRVFENLLKNAISYSYENSEIEISTENSKSGIIVKVRNKGKQIPKVKLEQIFEKFYRLDSARQTNTGGAGLGLAIAKEIVELHEGKISVESSDEYTEFMVTLPNIM